MPHRGSSTERGVGDMFDSDAGGLYLHFPELIPRGLWERRGGAAIDGGGEGGAVKREGGPCGKGRKGDGPDPADPKKHDAPAAPHKKKHDREGPFTNAQRPQMVAEFPGMRFTEQGVIMGERWCALTPAGKRPYEEAALRDKERYAKEMAAYIEGVKREIWDEKLLRQEHRRQRQHQR